MSNPGTLILVEAAAVWPEWTAGRRGKLPLGQTTLNITRQIESVPVDPWDDDFGMVVDPVLLDPKRYRRVNGRTERIISTWFDMEAHVEVELETIRDLSWGLVRGERWWFVLDGDRRGVIGRVVAVTGREQVFGPARAVTGNLILRPAPEIVISTPTSTLVSIPTRTETL